MLINVPQYIDVEDKVAGPFTFKQLGWLVALGVILLIMWNTMPGVVFFIFGFPIALLFLALTFYRPYGQPLGNFIIFGIFYYFRPKIYVWKRTSEMQRATQKPAQIQSTVVVDKKMTSENLRNLAQLLDSEGLQHSENIEDYLKKSSVKK